MSAQTVHIIYMFVVFWCDVTAQIILTGQVHTSAGLYNNGIASFSLTSRGLPFIEMMAGFEYTEGKMNVLPTVATSTRWFWGGDSVLVWSGIAHGFSTNLVVIKGNLNAKRYRNEILARHVIPLFQSNANISFFFSA